MWIFGYGSLVWKADFPYEEKVIGYIKGYVRRFWQASIDHRGVPGKPGRVVTLVKSDNPEETVWGVAYKISDDKKKEVISHLDYREKGGYIRHSVFFFPQYNEMDKWQLTIYVGTEDNPFYTGPVDEDNIAEVILSSEGPSGKNIDYLFNLARGIEHGAILVYTDESKLEAMVDAAEIFLNETIAHTLPAYTFIFTAELLAILMAVIYMIRSPSDSFVIYADTRSALQTLKVAYSPNPLVLPVQ